MKVKWIDSPEKFKVAKHPYIIIPYRNTPGQDRDKQLERMCKFIEGWGEGKGIRVLVIEQSDDGRKFNRGALLNIGSRIAMEEGGCDLLIFHDVDLYPKAWLWPYYRVIAPRGILHLASVWTTKYSGESFIGGVTSCGIETWRRSGGFPNFFWGWGGEDDAWRTRLVRSGATIWKVKGDEAGFDEVKHVLTTSNKEWVNETKREDRVKDSEQSKRGEGYKTVKWVEVGKREKLGKKIEKITCVLV